LRAPTRIGDSFAEHEEIVSAIQTRDGDLAAEKLRQHVMLQGERFSNLVKSVEKLSAPDSRRRA